MKKQAKSVNYGMIAVGVLLVGVLALLIVILVKMGRADDDYVINYRSDDKLAEQIVNKDKGSSSVVTDEPATTVDTSKYIAVQEALEKALTAAGTNRQSVRDVDVELEYKFGQVVYEVTFDQGQYEYEYYINAESGEMVKSFKEIDY